MTASKPADIHGIRTNDRNGVVATRVWIALFIACVALVAASYALRDRSIVWQGILHSVAVGAMIVSIRFLVEAAFTRPSWIISIGGLVCVALAIFGFTAARLMRHLQQRLL